MTVIAPPDRYIMHIVVNKEQRSGEGGGRLPPNLSVPLLQQHAASVNISSQPHKDEHCCWQTTTGSCTSTHFQLQQQTKPHIQVQMPSCRKEMTNTHYRRCSFVQDKTTPTCLWTDTASVWVKKSPPLKEHGREGDSCQSVWLDAVSCSCLNDCITIGDTI